MRPAGLYLDQSGPLPQNVECRACCAVTSRGDDKISIMTAAPEPETDLPALLNTATLPTLRRTPWKSALCWGVQAVSTGTATLVIRFKMSGWRPFTIYAVASRPTALSCSCWWSRMNRDGRSSIPTARPLMIDGRVSTISY